MDEVRADCLMEKYGKNVLLVIIHEWPQRRKYKEKPEVLPSLEYLVTVISLLLLNLSHLQTEHTIFCCRLKEKSYMVYCRLFRPAFFVQKYALPVTQRDILCGDKMMILQENGCFMSQ